MAKLHTQHGSLNAFQPIVVTSKYVTVLCFLAPVAKHPNPVGSLRVICSNNSTLAAGAQVLAGIEAETAEVPQRTSANALVLSSMRLGGIFDDGQRVLFRNRQDRIHFCRMAIEMHRDDGLRLRSDGAFHLERI